RAGLVKHRVIVGKNVPQQHANELDDFAVGFDGRVGVRQIDGLVVVLMRLSREGANAATHRRQLGNPLFPRGVEEATQWRMRPAVGREPSEQSCWFNKESLKQPTALRFGVLRRYLVAIPGPRLRHDYPRASRKNARRSTSSGSAAPAGCQVRV